MASLTSLLMDLDPNPTENEACSFFCNLWAGEPGIRAIWWTETLEAAKQTAISFKLRQDLSRTVP